MADEETSAKQELPETVAPEDTVPGSANDKVISSLQDRKPPTISAGKEHRLKAWQRAEVIVICAVIVIVWGLLSLPIVFYHMPPVRTGEAYPESSYVAI